MTRVYDRHLAAAGLTLSQYSVLSKLARRPALAMRQLAGAMGMERTTLTRSLAPLAERRLVALVSGEDRRSKLVSLTPDGLALLGLARCHWQTAQEEVVRRLGDDDLARLNALLDAAFEKLAD